MVNTVKAINVRRPVATPRPVRPRRTDSGFPHVDRSPELPRLLILIPIGSLVAAALLVIALSRILGTPALPPSPAYSRSADRQEDVLSVDELEIGETAMRLGPMVTR